jgi:hypothetical protein
MLKDETQQQHTKQRTKEDTKQHIINCYTSGTYLLQQLLRLARSQAGNETQRRRTRGVHRCFVDVDADLRHNLRKERKEFKSEWMNNKRHRQGKAVTKARVIKHEY